MVPTGRTYASSDVGRCTAGLGQRRLRCLAQLGERSVRLPSTILNPCGVIQCAGHLRRSHVVQSTAGSIPFPESEGSQPNGQGVNNPAAEYSVPVARIRGLLFYLWTFTLALPLFVTMLIQSPLVALLDKHRRLAQHFVNDVWAKLSTRLFYTVQVEGRENLPPADQPAVYVANHQSFLDIFTLFHLNRPFKFISKTSIFFIPIIGWSMFMTGHVRLNRMDKRSQMACLTSCRQLLQQGASVLFFPEGTRATDMCLQDFKKVGGAYAPCDCLFTFQAWQDGPVLHSEGAFSVAAKAKVPVVPISIVGTGRKMPNHQESKMFPGNVTMVVHPQVQPASADQMLKQAFEAVSNGLPQELKPKKLLQ